MLRLSLLPLLVIGCVAWAAPAPKEPPRPTAAAVRQAIGKSHLGKEIRGVGRSMGEDPVVSYAGWWQDVLENAEETHFDLRWKAKGLSLTFSRNNLHTAWMYNDKVEGYTRYIGELPESLSFDDTLATVEKRLGKPEIVFKTPPEIGAEKNKAGVQIDFIYKKAGVCVSFQKRGESEAVVRAIAMFPPGEAPAW